MAGTYRADRVTKIRKDGNAPTMPAWLTPPARKEWKRLVPKLRGVGLASVDSGTLGVYCQALADIGTLEATVRERGSTFVTEKGYIAKHPACTLLREARETVIKAGHKLALNPSARRGMPTLDDAVEIDELLAFQLNNAELTLDEHEFRALLAQEGVTAAQWKDHQKSKHFKDASFKREFFPRG